MLIGCKKSINLEGVWRYKIEQTHEYDNKTIFSDTDYPVIHLSDSKIIFPYGLTKKNIFETKYKIHNNQLHFLDKKNQIKIQDENIFLLELNDSDKIYFFKLENNDKKLSHVEISVKTWSSQDSIFIDFEKNMIKMIRADTISFNDYTKEEYLLFSEYLFNEINEDLLDTVYFDKNTFSEYIEYNIDIHTKNGKRYKIKKYGFTSRGLPIEINAFIKNLNFYLNLYGRNILKPVHPSTIYIKDADNE